MKSHSCGSRGGQQVLSVSVCRSLHFWGVTVARGDTGASLGPSSVVLKGTRQRAASGTKLPS